MPHLPLNICFAPKENLTSGQLDRINKIRSSFLKLSQMLGQEVPAGQARDKAFDLMIEAVEQLELAIQRPPCLTPSSLLVGFHKVESQDKRVTDIWLGANHISDLRKFGREVFEIESDASLLRQGVQGRVWGATVHVSRFIPVGSYVIIGEGEENLVNGQEPREDQLTKF
jgi:hypothetical protein